MKKTTKIGIPRALLYYRYEVFWTNFFTKLNCKIILSNNTTKEIIELGKNYSIDESCLSSKIYLGHISTLQNKCDYIFVPRIADYGKNKKVCMKFNGIYDTVKNIFPNQKLLTVNIEKTGHKFESIQYIKLGLKLNKNIFKVIYSYIYSKYKQYKHNKIELLKQNIKLNTQKLKVLIVSHPYNINDNYLGEPIKKILKEMDVEIIYANLLRNKLALNYAKDLSPTLYWLYSKELIGAIEYYKKYIDGIIFLTTFPCGPDSLVNELMIRKLQDKPITNIIIDEHSADAGIQTRLESFIDIIKERRKNNE